MADEAELVGGISVSVGATHAPLAAALAEAERMVQTSVGKMQAKLDTLSVGGTVRGVGTAGPVSAGGGASGTISQQQVAAIMAAVARNPSGLARIAHAQPKIVFGPGAGTAAASEQGQTALQRAINAELAKSGEVINEHTGEITKATEATRRSRVTKSKADEAPMAPVEVDISGLQAVVRDIQAVAAEVVSAFSNVAAAADAEAISAPAVGGGGGRRARTRLSPADAARLEKLSSEAQAYNPAYATPSLTASNQPRKTQAQLERDARDQSFASAANAARQRPPRQPDILRANAQLDEAAILKVSGRADDPEAREQRIQEDIARRRANITASGSTGRTSASRIGALFGGNQGRLIEAETRLAAARRNTTQAFRAAEPIERRISEYNDEISKTSGESAEALKRQRDAFTKGPEVAPVLKRQTDAIKGEATALKEFEKLQSGANIARNLTAVAVGSFAFSAALKAVDLGIAAIGTAVGPTLERLGGFASTTATYTANLADATRAASGNVQAVTALKLASTGLSSSTAATIQPLIQQRVQVEAGNKAIQDQIESLHVFENLRRSNQQAGITSTTGGFLGGPIGGIPSTGEQIGNLLSQQGQAARAATSAAEGSPGSGPMARYSRMRATGGSAVDTTGAVLAQKDFASSLQLVNDQLTKGGDSAAQLSEALDKTDPRIEQTAKSFDGLSPAMAAAIRENHLYSEGIKTQADALKALQSINIAGLLPDPQLLSEQFNRADQAMVRMLDRTQQFALQTQLPAQAGLQNLAQPLLPPGTGIVGRNAEEQRKIESSLGRSKELQGELNAYYAQGQKILSDTYHIPEAILGGISSLGKEIAGLQADIVNEQAGLQAKQYTYQLNIARRTLSDIGGLTDHNFGAGQSYLGVLEKQNLALSRQSQQLQFQMSQRQINFQTALAGFQAPGVTPEERQANVKAAQIEASFAQKQLDIQKQMFGNQVQIVDISNLRQGVDLAKQIALLVEGRRISIDVAVKQEQIVLAQKRSEQLVQQAGTYLSKIDTIAAAGISHIQELEVATGRALTRVETQALTLYSDYLSKLASITGQFFGGGNTGFAGNPGKAADDRIVHASGAIFQTRGATMVTNQDVAGEAQNETVAILRNVRPYNSGGGGGVNIGSIFSGPITVRSNEDIETIARKVQKVMGTTGALKGLRSAN